MSEPEKVKMAESINFGFEQAKNAFLSLSSSSNVLAVVAFFILIVIVFTILLRLCIALISYIFSSKNNVRLITGIVQGNAPRVFPQDPSIDGAITIERSNNAKGGIEFTWSVWINISSIGTGTSYQNIFTKGNQNVTSTGINSPNNAPGLYLSPGVNSLLFIMNTFEVVSEEIVIPDVPMNKWVNVVMTCENKIINIYINGVVAKSQQLIGVPKQNYGDVYIALGGGFDGLLSNLWYWNKRLDIDEIQTLFARGPSTTYIGNLNTKQRGANYLALDWYFNNS